MAPSFVAKKISFAVFVPGVDVSVLVAALEHRVAIVEAYIAYKVTRLIDANADAAVRV